MKTVILKRSALKNPVNRAPSVTLRDPSLALRMTGGLSHSCHSEARSDEESREQNILRCLSGSFAYTLPRMPFAGLLRDSPQSGAAAEIAARLSLPPAAAARNSQGDSVFSVSAEDEKVKAVR